MRRRTSAPYAIERSVPLTPLQEGMLFHHVSHPDTDVDLEQIVMTVREPMDPASFAAAWRVVVRRHAALRSAFRWRGVPGPRRDVYVDPPIIFSSEDWRDRGAPERDAAFERVLVEDRGRPFDLARPPLCRMRLFRLGESDWRVLWTFHHILLDGRSFPIVIRDLFAAWEALRAGGAPRFAPAPRFEDYLEWLRRRERGGDAAFWRSYLAGFRSTTRIGGPAGDLTGGPRRHEDEIILSAVATEGIYEAAGRHGVPRSTLVLAAWALLLSRCARDADVVFGVTRSGRAGTVESADSLAGVLINTVPLRVQVTPDAEIGAWLRRVRAQQLEQRVHEHASLADIQRWAGLPPGAPLFESIVVFDHARLGPALCAQGGAWTRRDFVLHERAVYPVTLYAYAEPRLVLRLAHDADTLPDGLGPRLLDALATSLAGLSDPRYERLGDLPVVSRAARQEAVRALGDTTRPVPMDASCLDALHALAARSPDAIAVRSGDEALTYGTLDEHVNSLASRLRSCGVGPGVAVGACCRRGPGMVIGLLGILQAGGTYVPLDPAHPAARHARTLRDAGARLLLADGVEAGALPAFDGPIIGIHGPAPATSVSGRAAAPGDTAYIMFTSGSTGHPKGVMVEHRNLLNFLAAMDEVVPIARRRTWLAVTGAGFDISVLELLWTLTRGFEVVIEPDEWSETAALLMRHDVSHLQCTPSRARMLLADPATRSALRGLDVLCVGGEALTGELARGLRAAVGGQVINLYGPTETTIWSSSHVVGPDEPPIVPIGRPIANTAFLVLDRWAHVLPRGVAGELWIGGAGVARGYVGRSDLTRASFVRHALVGDMRFYRTGDLVRWRDDGALEFLGRLDDQVKVRGHRVEPAEIEAVLAAHPRVSAVAVRATPHGDGDVTLCAYFVPRSGQADGLADELREHARRALPSAMVPSSLVALPQLPLTANGKLDRSALPPPPRAVGTAADGAALRAATPFAAAIAAIWQDVLGAAVGPDDNFFDLGGHSLLAVRAHDRLCRALGHEFPLLTLFRHPTVRTLAAALGQAAPADDLDGFAYRAAARRQALTRAAAAEAAALRIPRAG